MKEKQFLSIEICNLLTENREFGLNGKKTEMRNGNFGGKKTVASF
jgi:hypothetical protein